MSLVWRGALLGIAVGVVLAFAVTPARAHLGFNQYTHGAPCPAGPGNRIDPVNLVFFYWGTYDRVVSQSQYHMQGMIGHGNSWPGWEPQIFAEHGNCLFSTYHLASGQWWTSRYHYRLHPMYYEAGQGWSTLADAHYDQVVSCGHAVPYGGFNASRDVYWYGFNGVPNHGAVYGYLGNTDPRGQCNTWHPRSDGWALLVPMHQYNH